MYTIEGGKTELYEIIQKHQTGDGPEPVFLLDFMAPWCGPCKQIAPLLTNLTKQQQYQRPLYLFKIDVDEPGNEDLVAAFSVRSMPTLVWLVDGQIYSRVEGANQDKILHTTVSARSS